MSMSLSKMYEDRPLTILSLGAGVQSTVMALKASRGDFPTTPDYAIFADTGWEPKSVYKHLDWLETQLTFPVIRCGHKSLREDLLKGVYDGYEFTSIPAYVRGLDGKHSMRRRSCTRYYKIQPITQAIRKLYGLKPRERMKHRVTVWVGISTDEAIRMKPSRNPWQDNVYPLIEHNLSRDACSKWFRNFYPDRQLTKSACIGCPFHNNATWSHMKAFDTESWNDAVYIDKQIRNISNLPQYLHKQLKPLNEVNLKQPQLSMWGNECEGMCGV